MKEDNERKRKSNTRTIVNKKLLNYSIAAGAAVAMTQPAQAAVVITDPPDITIDGDNKFQKIDINGDAVFDFVFGFINNDLVIDDIANNNNLVFKYGYNDPFDDYALKFV